MRLLIGENFSSMIVFVMCIDQNVFAEVIMIKIILCCVGDKVKKNEMGWACGECG